MKASFNYFFFAILLIPVLPILYWQGRQVRKRVPRLGEAEDPAGKIDPPKGFTGRQINVLMLGESTFAGVGIDRHEAGIAGALAGFLASEYSSRVEWHVVAQSGYTIKKVNKRLVSQYHGSVPDIIVLGVGGNDAFNLTNPISWRLQVRKLINNVHKRFPGKPILFAAMPPVRDFPAFTALMRTILGGHMAVLGKELDREVQMHRNVYYQKHISKVRDLLNAPGSKLAMEDFFSDGVHPAALTYRLWGASLGEFIAAHKIL